MTLNDGDLFLVNDGTETNTVTFQELKKGKDSAMLNDSDLFLVNDGTKTETVTWKQIQEDAGTAPVIDSVTLAEDTPGTRERFTNQSFTSTIVMAEDGAPASAKGIRGWVDGSLIIEETQTDEIVGVSPDGHVLTFSSNKDLSVLEPGDYIEQENAGPSTTQASELDPADTVGGSITNNGLTFTASTASTYSRSKVTVEDDEKIQFEMTVDNLGSGALIGFSQEGTDGSPGPTIVGAVYDSTANIRYTDNWSTGPVGVSYTTSDIVGATYDNSTGEVTFYKNGIKQPSVFLTPNQPMKLYVHSNMGQVTANFGANGFAYPVEGFSNFERFEPAGIIGSIDVNGLTITMSKVYGDWGPENDGHYAIGPVKQIDAGKQYLKLDQATLEVKELQSAETPFTPIDTLNPKIKFGATLGTADSPDDILPEGTSIQTEVQAANGIQPDSIVESNPVTPISDGIVWSSYGSGAMASANYSWEKCFNGGPLDKENCVMPDFDQTADWIWDETPLGAKCSFYVNKQINNEGEFRVNGNVKNIADTDTDDFIKYTYYEPLQTFAIDRGPKPDRVGSDALRICAVEVDDIMLIDPITMLSASIDGHVAKFEAIKKALESYEPNRLHYRAELRQRLIKAGFTVPEIDTMGLLGEGEVADNIKELDRETKPKAKTKTDKGKRKRARNEDGTYRGDDPSTPDVNEAWEDG